MLYLRISANVAIARINIVAFIRESLDDAQRDQMRRFKLRNESFNKKKQIWHWETVQPILNQQFVHNNGNLLHLNRGMENERFFSRVTFLAISKSNKILKNDQIYLPKLCLHWNNLKMQMTCRSIAMESDRE